MKTLRTLLMAIAMLLCSTTVSAHDFEVDGIYYSITSSTDLTVSVTFKGSDATSAVYNGSISLPNVVEYNGNTYSVTGIASRAFSDCYNIVDIAIPNTVINIDSYAFKNCTSLTDITIPNSVTSIGQSAFSGCSNLTRITIPNSVTSIGSEAFSGCSNLPVENNIRYADSWAVEVTDSKQASYTLRTNTVGLISVLFKNCQNMINIEIPNKVRFIGNSAFYGCCDLTEISLPNSVTNIGGAAFWDCTGLKEISLPNSVTNIGSYAFSGCTGLTEITIPNSVTTIEYHAFSGCIGLTEITIPNSVTTIDDRAFSGCTGLTEITIPNSVTTLGGSSGHKVFEGCTNLTKVTIESQNVASMNYLGTCFGEQATTYILGDSVTSIGSYAFYYCTGLTDITIPNSVTSIEGEAFRGCTGLTEITIPNSVTTITRSAFAGTTNLTEVTIESQSIASMSELRYYFGEQVTTYILGNSVTSIGSSAFSGCTGLAEITIPSSVTSIGSSAFRDCTGLTEITIPNSVTSIGDNAFEGCTSLPVENNIRYADTWAVGVTDNTLVRYTLRENTRGLVSTFSGCTSLARVTLPESLIYVSDYAFSGCSSLNSFTLPDGVSTIGRRAFYNCTSLSDINIPSGVVSIGEYAFYDCSLTELTVPKGITEIMSSSFFGNDFSTVEIPEGVTSIGENAFGYCSNLESTSLPQSLTNISSSAFRYCSLSSITIPESVTSIGSTAFSGLKSVTLNSPTILSEGGFTDKFGNYVTEYVINADAEEIKDYAFYNSTALQSITLPETLISIGEGAFENCTQLDSVRIPLNVATIKDYAFSCCTGLKYLACNAPVPPTCGTDAFADVNTAECTLEVPDTVASIYATTAPWSSFNIKAVETPKEEIITRVDLVDGEAFENAEEALMDTITYTRTLNNLKWNALYLPFEVPMESLIENYDVAYVNSMHSYDYEDDGVLDSMTMEVVKIKEGILHANHPYLIRAKNEAAKAMNIVVENSTLYAAESVTLDCSSVYTRFEITGIYNPMSSAELDGCYALSGGTWMKLADGSTLNPFRLYLRITDREGSPVKIDSASPALYSVGIRVRGEGSSTGIEEHRVESTDAPAYDLMGRRVTNPQKGHLYIVNGKKVIF